MALILQDFKTWSANTAKVLNTYILPTNKSLFNVISSEFINIQDIALWNNLKDGDFINLKSDNTLPSPLTSQKYFIRKSSLGRISLFNTLSDAINNNNHINILNSGSGNHTLSFEFNFILTCVKRGETGIIEPVWNREYNNITIDNNCQWKTINPLFSDFDPLDFLPDERQKEEAWQKYSELLGHVTVLAQQESKPIFDKYKDYTNLEDKFIYQMLGEFGYEYLADASILDTNQLSTLLSYLKLIHFLKGTRQGLRLVLDLLGYQYTETLWYEKTPLGATNTFDLNLTVPVESMNLITVNALNKFLRFYVYPIANIVTDILPFTFVEGVQAGGGFGDQVYEFFMDFEIPLTLNNDLFNFKYDDNYGLVVTDSTVLENNGKIIQTENDPDALFRLVYNSQSLPIQDLSSKDNDASISSNNYEKEKKLFAYSYTENTGTDIYDDSITENNSEIIASYEDRKDIFIFKYDEGTGTDINDSSVRNNDAEIIESITYDKQVIGLHYAEGTGTTTENIIPDVGNANILSTTDIPRPQNLIAYYYLNNDALDSSGNDYHATVTGGSYDGLSLTLEEEDYISIPNTVLNNRGYFSFGGWFNINEFNYTGVDPTFLEQNCFISCNSGAYRNFTLEYSKIHKGFSGYINNTFYSFRLTGNYDNFDGQQFFETGGFHHVVLTKDNQLTTLFIDGELVAQGICAGGNIAVDSGGLIIGQKQNGGVATGFSPIQAVKADMDNLFFYNVPLTQHEVNKWYQRSRS